MPDNNCDGRKLNSDTKSMSANRLHSIAHNPWWDRPTTTQVSGRPPVRACHPCTTHLSMVRVLVGHPWTTYPPMHVARAPPCTRTHASGAHPLTLANYRGAPLKMAPQVVVLASSAHLWICFRWVFPLAAGTPSGGSCTKE